MEEMKITFPGYMERCCGFSIPKNGKFYIVSFDDLLIYDVDSNAPEEVETDWQIDEEQMLIITENQKIPFIGLWGGKPILIKPGVGELSLKDSKVCLRYDNGKSKEWQFENFSGDWEQVTFDLERDAFLFGAPYDFDFRYMRIT